MLTRLDVALGGAVEIGSGQLRDASLAATTRRLWTSGGVLAAPDIPEMLLAGRERELLGNWAFPQ